MRRRLRLQSSVLGLLIALGCVAVLWRQVDLKQSWNALSRLNGPFLLIPFLLFLLNMPLRAWRWQLIFPRSSRPGLASCFAVLGIGNMANFLFPGRAGDLSRCVLVGRTGSLNESSRALATLAIEKVLDGFALVAMVLFAAWGLHPPNWVIQLGRIAFLIFAGALGLLLVIRYRTRTLIDAVRQGFHWAHLSVLEEKFDHSFASFSDGLNAVGSIGQTLCLLALTALIWINEVGLIWALATALGLSISLKSSALASAVLGLGLMIPPAPGGLGTYELFGTEAFKLVGLASGSALALTVVIHAWVFVTNVSLGSCLLAGKGLSLAGLGYQLRGRTSDAESEIGTSL